MQPKPSLPTIHYVSSTDSPQFSLFKSTLNRSSIIALDAEWKPNNSTHNKGATPTVALLQIACRVNGVDRVDQSANRMVEFVDSISVDRVNKPVNIAHYDSHQVKQEHTRHVSNNGVDSVNVELVDQSCVFLFDLLTIKLSDVYGLLRDVFVERNVLKLGFRFKQDFVYLSSTFAAIGEGCEGGFDRLEPFLDVASIYGHLQRKEEGRRFSSGSASSSGNGGVVGGSKVGTVSNISHIHHQRYSRSRRKTSKETKSLATICEEVLGYSLSKELQCSDWSHRPLTEAQILYAAADAQCLLEIFDVFQQKIKDEGNFLDIISALLPQNLVPGLKDILQNPSNCTNVVRPQICQASDMVKSISVSNKVRIIHAGTGNGVSCEDIVPLSPFLTKIVRKYGDAMLLKKSDRKLKASKKKKNGKGKWFHQKRVYGLKDILEEFDGCKNVLNLQVCQASDMVRSANISQQINAPQPIFGSSGRHNIPLNDVLSKMIKQYGERILLKDIDRKLKGPKRKSKRPSLLNDLRRQGNWVKTQSDPQGSFPVDISLEGDKFLCDAMVVGLAKHLRCVGIDAAVPLSRKPEPRELINQAQKEKRVLLTRDSKLMRYEHLVNIYKIKNLLKNDQLLEVIEAFQLKISEGSLMSRCTKCNGTFIQKPLTTEEAIQAGKGFQVIPNCLFNRNLEFWQCVDCNQLYWEGTQYHHAIQKFVDVCKLND